MECSTVIRLAYFHRKPIFYPLLGHFWAIYLFGDFGGNEGFRGSQGIRHGDCLHLMMRRGLNNRALLAGSSTDRGGDSIHPARSHSHWLDLRNPEPPCSPQSPNNF
eukprot:1331138-Amphidinium_carterae.1